MVKQNLKANHDRNIIIIFMIYSFWNKIEEKQLVERYPKFTLPFQTLDECKQFNYAEFYSKEIY